MAQERQPRKLKVYLSDPSVEVPRATLYRWKQQSARIEQLQETKEQDESMSVENSKDCEINEIENLNKNQQYDYSDEILEEENDQDENNEIDDINEAAQISQDQIRNIFNKGYSKQDLTVALLTLFYAAKFTQSGFNLTLKLMNQLIPPTNQIQIPSSFNTLCRDVLSWTGEKIQTNRKWYCPVCLEIFDQLNSQFQRNCSQCETR